MHSTSSPHERRQYPRYLLVMTAEIWVEGYYITAYTHNISMTGVMIEFTHPLNETETAYLKQGTTIWIKTPDKQVLEFKCDVTHCTANMMGARFIRFSEQTKAVLDSIIGAIQQNGENP